jgi:hypothetical protein
MNLEPQGYLLVYAIHIYYQLTIILNNRFVITVRRSIYIVRSLQMIHISIVHWVATPAVYFGNVISTHLKIYWISPTQFGIATVVLQCSVEKSPSRKRVLLLKEGLDIYSNVIQRYQYKRKYINKVYTKLT